MEAKLRAVQLRRLVLLIVAITVHNFPEGLAVGVGYASVGRPGEGYIYSKWTLDLNILVGDTGFPF